MLRGELQDMGVEGEHSRIIKAHVVHSITMYAYAAITNLQSFIILRHLIKPPMTFTLYINAI